MLIFLKKSFLYLKKYIWLVLLAIGSIFTIFLLFRSIGKDNEPKRILTDKIEKYERKTWEINTRTKLELDAIRKESKEEHQEIKEISKITDGRERRRKLADKLKSLKK